MRNWVTLDGNKACARVAYHLSDVIAILPDHSVFQHGGGC